MPDPKDIVISPDQVKDPLAIPARDRAVAVSIKKRKTYILEMEDVLFHFDSAVMLPSAPAGPSSKQGKIKVKDQWLVSGLEVLKLVYIYAQLNPEYKMILAGHTDTSGPDYYNFDLSKLRATAVMSLLKGDRKLWVKTVRNKYKVEDYQQILKHCFLVKGWDCDPGEINDKNEAPTKEALRNFQAKYNAVYGQTILVDGKIGKQTWGAIYDVYMTELAGLMAEKSENGLEKWRAGIIFVDDKKPFVGCGESAPIDSPGLDNNKSQTNRRIEFVFFPKDMCPLINCPKTTKTKHPLDKCPLYNHKANDFEYIDPTLKDNDIRIVKIDDHFVPGVKNEELRITYEFKGHGVDHITMQFTSDNYKDGIIYEQPITGNLRSAGMHTVEWTGRAGHKIAGKLQGKLVNPLYSPYKVKFVNQDNKVFDEKEFKVLYHSVNLTLGSYTAEGPEPDKKKATLDWVKYSRYEQDLFTNDIVRWTQLKLNKLGYYAGPVDGNANSDQMKRAIKRYTYAMPGMNEIDDHTNNDLQKHLDKEDARRQVIDENKLPDTGKEAKLYLDHNYYYSGSLNDFSKTQGHSDKDKAKLDRCEIPIEASVLLLSRDDKDGTKDGVKSDEAVGEVEIEWIVKDPIEDTSNLTSAVPFKKHVPSRTKQYVEAALQAKGQDAAKPNDAKDNCPIANNGASGTNKDFFRIGADLPPFTSRNNGDKVYSKIHQDIAASQFKLGRTGIIFRMSYIAGDNYVLRARISFDDLGNKADLEKFHKNYTGKKIEEILFTDTGKITIWRRQNLAAQINWPEQPKKIKWSHVEEEYKYAHCLLSTNKAKIQNIENLWSTNADRTAYITLAQNTHPTIPAGDFKFDDQGVYPLKVPAQGNRDADKYEKDMKKLIKGFVETPGLSFLFGLAQQVRASVSKTERDGGIAICCNWSRPIKVEHSFLLFWTKTQDFYPDPFCIGLVDGVIMLGPTYLKKYQDRFLVTHEFGHCRYLKHHETKGKAAPDHSDAPNDHDLNDHNCAMCYPWGIRSRNQGSDKLEWKKGQLDQSRFCGKCVMKLRGWKVADGGLPGQS